MYRTLKVLVINWETLNCDKMEQFLTLLFSNDNEEPKPVEERKCIWQPGRGTWSLQSLPTVVYTGVVWIAWVSGVSGDKGKDGSKKGSEVKERNTWHRCFLLEPSTPTQHDSIPSNQNHFRSLGCQLHVSKSSPKIKSHFTVWPSSGACVAAISLFSETSNEEFFVVLM